MLVQNRAKQSAKKFACALAEQFLWPYRHVVAKKISRAISGPTVRFAGHHHQRAKMQNSRPQRKWRKWKKLVRRRRERGRNLEGENCNFSLFSLISLSAWGGTAARSLWRSPRNKWHRGKVPPVSAKKECLGLGCLKIKREGRFYSHDTIAQMSYESSLVALVKFYTSPNQMH